MDITMIYLLLVVISLRPRVDFTILRKGPMKLYMGYIIFIVFLTIVTYGTDFEAIAVIRLWIYMVLGYFVLLLIFSAVCKKDFIQFFNVLFWANAIQSVFYVLNSSRILPLFDQSLIYLEVESGSGSFLRDFNTIPIFSGLLFTYGLASTLLNEKHFQRKAVYASLATYPFVLLFTFTRSILFSAGIGLVIVLVILVRYRSSILFKPYVLVLILGGAFVFLSLKSYFANEFDYFNERIEGAMAEGKNESNVDVRIQYHYKAWEIMSKKNSLIFGNGFNKRLNSRMDDIGAWAADSSIPFLLINSGIVGVIMFLGLQLYFLVLSIRNLLYELTSLAIALFASLATSIISFFIMGGVSWGSPLLFFNFVLVMYLYSNYQKEMELTLNQTNTSS